MCVRLCLSVYPHDKTKTAETNFPQQTFRTDSPSRVLADYEILRNITPKIKVTKCKNIEDDQVAGVSYALYRVSSL